MRTTDARLQHMQQQHARHFATYRCVISTYNRAIRGLPLRRTDRYNRLCSVIPYTVPPLGHHVSSLMLVRAS